MERPARESMGRSRTHSQVPTNVGTEEREDSSGFEIAPDKIIEIVGSLQEIGWIDQGREIIQLFGEREREQVPQSLFVIVQEIAGFLLGFG